MANRKVSRTTAIRKVDLMRGEFIGRWLLLEWTFTVILANILGIKAYDIAVDLLQTANVNKKLRYINYVLKTLKILEEVNG